MVVTVFISRTLTTSSALDAPVSDHVHFLLSENVFIFSKVPNKFESTCFLKLTKRWLINSMIRKTRNCITQLLYGIVIFYQDF